LAPQTAGTVAVVLPARPTDGPGGETVVPDQVYATAAARRGWRIGVVFAIESDGRTVSYFATRWRGLVRVADADGNIHMVRRWTKSRASADAQTREAGLALLTQFERNRVEAEKISLGRAAGDRTTSVWDLIEHAFCTPSFAKLAPKTQQDYRYAARLIAGTPLASMLPRDVDVAAIRRFMPQCAAEHGSGGAKHARAVLSRAMNIAVETANMRTPFNPVLLARDAIPTVSVRKTGLDHRRAPTDPEVEALLAALRSDPEANPMIPGVARPKSQHGAAGTAPVNGKEVADLVLLLFRTGARIGEIAALRWSDVNLEDLTVSISGSLLTLNGQGTIRQERTKIRGSVRTVPLSEDAGAALRARAALFEISLDDPEDLLLPVFGSLQFPERLRDYRNLTKAIKELFTRHGIDYGRGHLGRKWLVTSLVERGVPVHKTADLVLQQ